MTDAPPPTTPPLVLTPPTPPPPVPTWRRALPFIIGFAVLVVTAVAVFAFLRFLDPGNKFPDTPAAEPVLYSSSEHGYSVEFPGTPEESSQNLTVGGHEVTLYSAGFDAGNAAWASNSVEFPAELVSEVGGMLEGSINGAISSTPGATLTSTEELVLDGLPALRGEATTPDGPLHLVVAFDGPIQYQLLVFGAELSEADRFFDSFRLG